MGEKSPLDDETVTHGMCRQCADIYIKRYRFLKVLELDDIEGIIKYIEKAPKL